MAYYISLDGVDDLVTVGSVNTLVNRIEIDFYTATDILPNGTLQGLMNLVGSNSSVIYFGNTTSTYPYEIITLAISGTTTGWLCWNDSAGKIPAGWNNLIIQHDGSIFRMYLDGVEKPLVLKDGSQPQPFTPSNVIFGKRATGNFFKGGLKKVNFQYNGTTIADWRFDEGAGTTIHDYSGNNYNGTLTGGTWLDDGAGGIVGSTAFDLRPILYADSFSTPDTKQNLYADSSVNADIRNVLYSDGYVLNDSLLRLYQDSNVQTDTKQAVYSDSVNGYDTKLSFYHDGAFSFDTLQEFFSDGIVGSTPFDIRQVLYGDQSAVYDSKQAIYTDGSVLSDVAQFLYQASQIQQDLKLIIYADTSTGYDSNQQIFTDSDIEFDTFQSIFDVDKQIIGTIHLQGMQVLNIYLIGQQALNVNLQGKQELNVNLKGVI